MATRTPLQDLADQAVAMAETLRELLPEDVGFVLVLTGIPTGGSMIHVSSKVGDAVEVLERSLDRAIRRRDTPPAAGN